MEIGYIALTSVKIVALSALLSSCFPAMQKNSELKPIVISGRFLSYEIQNNVGSESPSSVNGG